MICLISFSKFSDLLPAFTCARAIGNLQSICLGINIFSCVTKSERRVCPCFSFIGDVSL